MARGIDDEVVDDRLKPSIVRRGVAGTGGPCLGAARGRVLDGVPVPWLVAAERLRKPSVEEFGGFEDAGGYACGLGPCSRIGAAPRR